MQRQGARDGGADTDYVYARDTRADADMVKVADAARGEQYRQAADAAEQALCPVFIQGASDIRAHSQNKPGDYSR